MFRLKMATALMAAWLLVGTTQAVDIVWDGGDGAWNSFNWNGGQDAFTVFGRENGMEIGSGEIGTDIFINSSNVTYDPNAYDDFRIREGVAGNGGTLSISGGASLSMETNFGDTDGHWTQFNAQALNLDNGVFRRGFDAPAESGGVFSFGGTRGHDDMDISINITNGGGIENDGQLTFGWYLNNYIDRKVNMTINDGYLDLTGGDNYDALDGAVGGLGNADLHIQYGWDELNNVPAGEEYSINFTGPGSISVDHSGILVVYQTGPGDQDFDFDSIMNVRTYEYLWDIGILQANGRSGLDGETFGDHFSVTGTAGADGYVLTSLIGGENADFDFNDIVDGDDFLIWQTGFGGPGARTDGDANNDGVVDGDDFLIWQTQFGGPPPGAASAAVPEPGSLWIACLVGLAMLDIRRRR